MVVCGHAEPAERKLNFVQPFVNYNLKDGWANRRLRS